MDFERAKALCRSFPGATEAEALLRRSYELIFAKLTKKLQRELSGTA